MIFLLIYVICALFLFLISMKIDKNKKTTTYVFLSFFNCLLWPVLVIFIIVMFILENIKEKKEERDLEKLIEDIENVERDI